MKRGHFAPIVPNILMAFFEARWSYWLVLVLSLLAFAVSAAAKPNIAASRIIFFIVFFLRLVVFAGTVAPAAERISPNIEKSTNHSLPNGWHFLIIRITLAH